MILLASIMILMQKYSRQEDIVIGSPISGRTHKDTEDMMGMFVNTLAMRGKPEGEKTFKNFLEEIKDVSLNAYENQEYPFEELVEAVNIKRDMGRNPLFDVMFVLQNNEETKEDLKDIVLRPLEIESNIAKFDLTITMNSNKNEYGISFEYCTDLFKEETVENMVKHFEVY